MSVTVMALGGRAIAPGDDLLDTTADAQLRRIADSGAVLAQAVADGRQLVISHGNGPQIGNLITKNEIARDIVPAMPLDWCVAQTQATIGTALAAAIEREPQRVGMKTPVVPLLTRILVEGSDPAFSRPTKPIGRYIRRPDCPSVVLPDLHRWIVVREGCRRRAVPSPRPVGIVDAASIDLVLSQGAIVVACGGGGAPVIRDDTGCCGVEAVIDKDLTSAVLARQVDAARLVISPDVAGAAIDFDRPTERFLGAVSSEEPAPYFAAGMFGVGSLEPKVQAALEFVDSGELSVAIGALKDARVVFDGNTGTQVTRMGTV